MPSVRTHWQPVVIALVAALTSACFGGASDNRSGGTGTPPGSNNANRPPTISGSPVTSLVVGENYSFAPSASDPDGDALAFSIENRPVWAAFDASTGRLSGTPGSGDVGQFSNIRITVTDGRGASAQLVAFAISVDQMASGSVTLSWNPPTTNSDGTAIADLAGYRIYYGRSSGTLNNSVDVANPGITRWVVQNLSQATWYFSMTSYNAAGMESSRSPVISRTLI